MCNKAEKARALAAKGHREQDHVIANLWAMRSNGNVDRFEYAQRCALARARRAVYAEILEVLA